MSWMTVADEAGAHVGWAAVDPSVFRGGSTFEWASTTRVFPYPTRALVSTDVPPSAVEVRRHDIRIDADRSLRRGVVALVLGPQTAPEDLEELFPFAPAVAWLMARVRHEITNAARTG